MRDRYNRHQNGIKKPNRLEKVLCTPELCLTCEQLETCPVAENIRREIYESSKIQKE